MVVVLIVEVVFGAASENQAPKEERDVILMSQYSDEKETLA